MWSLWLLVAAIAIGVALRVYQFTADSSLWLDELALANNLAERSLRALLTEPLAYAQVAPPGFLLIEKALYELFGPNDRALRLYSLAAGIGSLGAAGLVCIRLGHRETSWVGPLLLSLSAPLIFQSAQIKPYSGDVLLSLALIALALRLAADPDAGRVWPATFGVLAPWLSFAAALTLSAIAVVLLASSRRRRLIPVAAFWGLSTFAALLYASTLVHPDTAVTMETSWSENAAGFPPRISSLVPWTANRFSTLLWLIIGLRGVTFWLGVTGVGAALLWRRSRVASAVVTAPILVAVVVAATHRYPLADRVSHWIAALLVILIATAAAEAAIALRRWRFPWLVALPAVLVITIPIVILATSPPPYRIDHVKPVFLGIAQHQQADDWLVVQPGAWHAYRYYAALSGIPPSRVVFGRCSRRSRREALRQLDSLRGKPRVWVLFVHVVTQEQREMLLSYLDTIGVRRQSVTTPDPYVPASASVDVHLYDLSDTVQLRNAAWDTYPVPRADLPEVRTRCMLGIVPME